MVVISTVPLSAITQDMAHNNITSYELGKKNRIKILQPTLDDGILLRAGLVWIVLHSIYIITTPIPIPIPHVPRPPANLDLHRADRRVELERLDRPTNVPHPFGANGNHNHFSKNRVPQNGVVYNGKPY